MIYYVDPERGNDANDGISPDFPKKNHTLISPEPGDKVLFRRGSFIRGCLERKPGSPEAPIYYGAYGEGENPVFCGSVDTSDPRDWKEIRKNIWQYSGQLDSEVCNFIFDNRRTGATLCWEESGLSEQGDWYDPRMGEGESHRPGTEGKVLLYSEENPGNVYSHIECAVFGRRNLSPNVSYTVVEDLIFFGSGVHAMAGGAHDVAVRRCSFLFIGGAVWNKKLRIRFGNAIEFWNTGVNVIIEDCYFNNIYDSCITQQGGRDCVPANNIVMRNNLFANYGMAAYEGRDRMPVKCGFTGNICLFAGGGFSAFGDTVPRNSEIYPQPMGHHVFLWRITDGSDGGSFTVRNNIFHEAAGAAVYAIIADSADAQTEMSGNTYYTTNSELMNKRGSRSWTPDEYSESGIEPGAVFAKNDVRELAARWFARTGCSSWETTIP